MVRRSKKRRLEEQHDPLSELPQQHDRLSELPDTLLHRILSLLPTDEAVATSVLSKAWKDVWITQPCLELGKSLFFKKFTPFFTLIKSENLFLDFVDRTLRSPSLSCVQQLHLFVPWFTTNNSRALLDGWITQAFRSFKLEELTVDTVAGPYKLPSEVFVCAYYSLKRLSLTRVKFSSKMISGWLASSCPFIESLCLKNCKLPGSRLKVSGLTNLAEFVIMLNKHLDKLEICAPKLLLLECHVYYDLQGDFGINLVECDKLQCLRIDSIITTGSGSVLLDPSIFCYLETLEIGCSMKLKTDFFIFSHRLKSLFLGVAFACPQSFIQFDAPNLKQFTYVSGKPNITFGLEFSCIDKATVRLGYYHWKDVQVLDFLKKFNHCETLEIETYNCQNIMIQQSVRQHTSGPLLNVKHLVLTVENFNHPVDMIGEIVDTLLWLCPHPQSIAIALCLDWRVNEMMVLKFKYKAENNDTRKYGCCKFLPNPCRQHSLEEVWIEIYKGVHANVKSYEGEHETKAQVDDKIKAFFENAVKRKKIIVNTIKF